MKALKVAGFLAALAVGGWLLVVLLETAVLSEKMFNRYVGRLNNWVAKGGPISSFQTDVVESCGPIVMSQASFFRYLSMATFDRANLDFRVDVASR
jgi:hypothetical protein